MSLVAIKQSRQGNGHDDDDDDNHDVERREEKEDWELPLAFNKPRHTATIEGINCITQFWRLKERVWYLNV